MNSLWKTLVRISLHFLLFGKKCPDSINTYMIKVMDKAEYKSEILINLNLILINF